jgi:hypothetical protein
MSISRRRAAKKFGIPRTDGFFGCWTNRGNNMPLYEGHNKEEACFMKWHFCLKRFAAEQEGSEVAKMASVLLRGGIVHWGRFSQVKAFTEPLHQDGTPAVELGYINMLVEGPAIDYLKDKIKLSKITKITVGWPRIMKGQPKRYPRA